MSKEILQSFLGSKIVSFHAVFAKVIGSVPAAVMLSQAFFWQEKAKHKTQIIIEGEEYFCKTSDEWYEETSITKEQQATARAHLCKCGVLKEKRAGLPAKMHYRVDIDCLVAVISQYLKTGEKATVDYRSHKREITRDSSGKIRRKAAVFYGSNSIESYESSDSKGEVKATPTREQFNAAIDGFIEAKKEKAPSIAGGSPTHTVKTIEPGSPVIVVEGVNIEPGNPTNPNATTALFNRMGLQPKATNGDEADAILTDWAAENLETVKLKYNRAKRKFTPEDLDKLIVKFCGQYASNKDTGTRERFLYDPARFFNDKLNAWLVDQPGFEKMAERKDGTKKAGTPNAFGGDQSRYAEKQKF